MCSYCGEVPVHNTAFPVTSLQAESSIIQSFKNKHGVLMQGRDTIDKYAYFIVLKKHIPKRNS